MRAGALVRTESVTRSGKVLHAAEAAEAPKPIVPRPADVMHQALRHWSNVALYKAFCAWKENTIGARESGGESSAGTEDDIVPMDAVTTASPPTIEVGSGEQSVSVGDGDDDGDDDDDDDDDGGDDGFLPPTPITRRRSSRRKTSAKGNRRSGPPPLIDTRNLSPMVKAAMMPAVRNDESRCAFWGLR